MSLCTKSGQLICQLNPINKHDDLALKWKVYVGIHFMGVSHSHSLRLRSVYRFITITCYIYIFFEEKKLFVSFVLFCSPVNLLSRPVNWLACCVCISIYWYMSKCVKCQMIWWKVEARVKRTMIAFTRNSNGKPYIMPVLVNDSITFIQLRIPVFHLNHSAINSHLTWGSPLKSFNCVAC